MMEELGLLTIEENKKYLYFCGLIFSIWYNNETIFYDMDQLLLY